ncbi:hypothetical protein A1351_04945 [Methylosinus sp. R-45379]|uniref:hypothetical protein n=1 Tax=Methylosinus sp. R-45379 TaxID=980563 RepID=UPI0007C8D447|nr:hypothetical protein [Methylosinus sp. R-45379]OAI31503.1 hypothetical protein A1351_04945 [Methylosinus sp. R-45379]
MKMFSRPYVNLRLRSAQSGVIPIVAPAELRDLRLTGRRMRPRAAWTIDAATRRPVCLWDKETDTPGRAEDEDAQSRQRGFSRRHARLIRSIRERPFARLASRAIGI